jgi:hypothetical protein
MPYQSRFGIDWTQPTQNVQAAPQPTTGYQSRFGIDWSAPAPEQQSVPEDVPFGDIEQFAGPGREYSIPEKIIGGAEGALAVGSAATTGLAGLIGGGVAGVPEAVRQGSFGPIAEGAQAGAEALSYAPRTGYGEKVARRGEELLSQTDPLGPLAFAGAVPRLARGAKAAAKTRATADIIGDVKKGGKRAVSALEDIADQDPQIAKSAGRLKVADYLDPDHVSTNEQLQDIYQLVKTTPGSELKSSETGKLAEVAKTFDDIVSDIGATDDISTLSVDIKNRLATAEKRLKQTSGRLYDEARELIEPTQTVETPQLRQHLAARTQEVGGIKNLPAEEKKLARALADGDLTYGYLDEMRQELGAGLRGKGAFAGLREGRRKFLYSLLSTDQRVAAESLGAGTKLRLAQKSARLYKSVQDDMGALFGKHLDSSFISPLTTAYNKIPKGDITALTRILESVPPSMRQQVAATGLNAALGKLSKTGKLSFNSFADFYRNASRNRASFNEWLKYMPSGTERVLRDMYHVSNGIARAQKHAIYTGRGEDLRRSLYSVDSLLSKILGATGFVGKATGRIPGGSPVADLISMAVGTLANAGKSQQFKAIEDLLGSPQLKRVLNERVRTGASTEKAIGALARSKQFARYVNEFGVEVGTSPQTWLIGAMQADVQTGEE